MPLVLFVFLLGSTRTESVANAYICRHHRHRSFWSQLVLTVVSSIILLFSTGVSSGGTFTLGIIDIATLFGIVFGLISTFLAWTYTQEGRKLGMLQSVRLPSIAGTVIANCNLNLLGMGATIVALQVRRAAWGSRGAAWLHSCSSLPNVGRQARPANNSPAHPPAAGHRGDAGGQDAVQRQRKRPLPARRPAAGGFRHLWRASVC